MTDDGTITWAELLEEAERRLAVAPFETAPREARWIVEEAAGGRLDAVGPTMVTERGIAHFDAMLLRREGGEPIQYVLGHWPFRTLDLMVDRRVLIPRPETEVVAGLAVDEVQRRRGTQTVVDLGTGSGAIALSIAAECVRSVEVWATDRSPDALEIARANTAGLGRRGSAVRLVSGDWFDALPDDLRGRVDVLVSNPPYVADDDPLPEPVAAWEPVEALRAGPGGLDDLRRLVTGAGEWLRPGGLLVLELDPRQAETIAELAASVGFEDVEIHEDLAGRSRAVTARRT